MYRLMLKRDVTRCLPCSTSCARRAGWPTSFRIAAASAFSSRSGTNHPSLPCSIISGVPPVLATSTGGTPEIIEHGKDGWLVPLRDENALAAAILKLVGQPALRAQLVEHGRQRVTSRFSINRYMTEVQKFYLKSDVIDTSSLYRKRQNAAA